MLTLETIQIGLGAFSLTADVTIPAGGITAVIGPSGAGKSTLLSAIAGFQALDKGQITWFGRDLTSLAPGDRPVSMLFQDGNLFPHLTAAQNVGLGLSPSLTLSAQNQDAVANALEAVSLGGMGDRRPSGLSGGQQSRVALARVLVQARPLVLLDEPFSALGPGLRAEMLDLTRNALQEQGATVLMITHDPEDARRIADRALVVADGEVHPPTPIGTFFDAPPAALQKYFGTTL